ncbi:MAG TPA: peptidoglycan bridge formation glycyltransferase FemA/FemB family protein [Methylomirabilota bacterium]|nr:peptidoglycan bridge formation glycyltransferase FemA/FemB family protein [Methylomirabilota bacterium]
MSGAAGYRLLTVAPEQRPALERFVLASPYGHFRQLPAWGDVAAYDGTPTVTLAVERQGRVCASLALTVRRLPRTPWTFLVGARGPIVGGDAAAVGLLVDGVREVARRHRSVFLRVDPDRPDGDDVIRPLLARHGFQHVPRDWSSLSDPRIVMRVDLRPPEADLLGAMRKKHRQHVRGAAKRGLKIRPAFDRHDVDRFAALMTAHGQEKGFAVRGPEYFHALWSRFVRAGLGELLLVELDGETCGGGLVVLCGARSWFLYTATDPRARGAFPGEPLYWEIMRWAKERGAEECDFGGTGTGWPPDPDSPAYSRYFFKLGFNAQPVYLTGYYDLVFRRLPYRLVRLVEDHLLDHGPLLVNLLRGRA